MSAEATQGRVRLRARDGVALLRIMNPAGKLVDFYGAGPRLLPEWADHNEAQVQHLLNHDLVELADDAGNPSDPGRAWECLSALIALGLPEDAGAPRARDALRSNGFRYSNDTICKAVALRKSGAKYGEAQ